MRLPVWRTGTRRVGVEDQRPLEPRGGRLLAVTAQRREDEESGGEREHG